MVKMNTPEVVVTKGEIIPIMHQHQLTVTKQSKQFTLGESLKCFVAKYSNGRFAVWDCSWLHHNKYEVFSEAELHETFSELSTL